MKTMAIIIVMISLILGVPVSASNQICKNDIDCDADTIHDDYDTDMDNDGIHDDYDTDMDNDGIHDDYDDLIEI